MTFPELENTTMEQNNKKSNEVSKTLKSALTKAKDEGRLTGGVFECAKMLEMDPEQIMVCILPAELADDITTNIQHKLIEAYCWENDIKVIKVDSLEKLAEIVNSPKQTTQKTSNSNPVTTPSIECSCLLMSWPPKDDKLDYNEDKHFANIWPHDVITLPD